MAYWEREARLYLGDATPEFVLTRPQKSFRYPETPRWPEGSDLFEETRRLVFAARPESVSLHADLAQALVRWLGSLGLSAGAKIGAQRPYLPELIAASKGLGLTLVPLDREPLALAKFDFSSLAAVVVSNPHRPDGFFYPDELYLDLYRKIRGASRTLPLLSEEGLNLFSFNSIPPGSWAQIKGDPHLYIAGSVYPVLSPQGPELSWWYSREALEPQRSTLSMSSDDLELAARSMLAFNRRQGTAVAEFQRRMLAVERGLRIVADILKTPLAEGLIEVPMWPETGFHLMIDITKVLRGKPVKPWALGLAKETGILVNPGHLFGEPHKIQICYAASHPFLTKLSAHVESIDRNELNRG